MLVFNTYIDEGEFFSEDYEDSTLKHFNQNREIWSNYLVPGCDSIVGSNIKQKKK